MIPVSPVSYQDAQNSEEQAVTHMYKSKHSGLILLYHLLNSHTHIGDEWGARFESAIPYHLDGIAPPFCPLVEQGATRYWSAATQSYSDMSDGTGCKGKVQQNNARAAKEVYNGGSKMWPDEIEPAPNY